MNYNFSVLNDKEFENFVRDLLNCKYNWDLQSFKNGKDKGRDLRYSTSGNTNSIIVQVKQYSISGYRLFLRDIKKELSKVKSMKPDRYIIATSVSLSAENKDFIHNFFNPYIKSPNDIFGKEDLNKMLSQFKDIEAKWFKLWMTSTSILNRIIHNAVHGRSEFIEEKIKRNLQLYDHVRGYNEALEILKTFKYILITGHPGVGKTTLAHLLSYELLCKNYQLIYVDGNLKEVEHILSPNPKVKQFFFFDDFFGDTYFDIINPKTSESTFVNFLERIKTSKNKYLILTTRTSIYRNALDQYEKVKRIRVDVARKEIQLGEYTILEKARIFYNHIFHSTIPADFKKEIFKDKKYWEIFTHKNYNPRLIEFITESRNLDGITSKNYLNFVFNNLKNPQEVWKYCYEKQLTVEERILLHSVFSQTYNTSIKTTQVLFDSMLSYEINNYNYQPKSNPFNNSCKKLLDGILKRVLHTQTQHEVLEFINPSLPDFIKHYFLSNPEEKLKLLRSSNFIEQFEQYYQLLYSFETELNDYIEFLKITLEKFRYMNTFHDGTNSSYLQLRIASLISRIPCVDPQLTLKIDSFTSNALKNYDLNQLDRGTRYHYERCIRYYQSESEVSKFVKENWDRIISRFFQIAVSEEDFEEINALFSEYDQKFEVFLSSVENIELVIEQVNLYLKNKTDEWFFDAQDTVESLQDWEQLKTQIKEKRESFLTPYQLTDFNYEEEDYFKDYDLENIILRNKFLTEATEKEEIFNSPQPKSNDELEESIREIELLFEGNIDSKFVSQKLAQLSNF